MIEPDVLADRLERAIERGELTDAEAREEWRAAEADAWDEMQELWR